MKTQKRNNLLGISNAKTSKGENLGVLTGILYLAPHTIAGKNLCPFASAGCAAACLYSAGRGAFNSVQRARIAKTKLFHANPALSLKCSLLISPRWKEKQTKRE
jgi:hypothetical protein